MTGAPLWMGTQVRGGRQHRGCIEIAADQLHLVKPTIAALHSTIISPPQPAHTPALAHDGRGGGERVIDQERRFGDSGG